MINFCPNRLLVVGLRGISVFFKFMLFIFLGKIMIIEDFGTLMLILTISTFSVHIIGLDIYMYSNRELVINTTSKQIEIVESQVKSYLLSYVFFLPIIAWFITSFFLKFEFLAVVIMLIVSEHLGQELFRILNILNQQLIANILNFLRTGLFPIVILFSYLIGFSPSMNFILFGFFFFNFLAVIYGVVILRQKKNFFKSYLGVSVRVFLKNGYQIFLVFFVGSFFQKIFEFGNRFYVETFYNVKYVAVLSFFSQVGSILNIIVDVAIISVVYPLFIEYFNNRDLLSIKSLHSKSIIKLSSVASFLLIFSFLFSHFFLKKIGKIEFVENVYILNIILVGNFFWNLFLLNQTLLYASRNEKYNLKFLIILGILNIPMIHLFSMYYSFFGVVLSNVFLSVLMVIFSYFQIIKLKLI